MSVGVHDSGFLEDGRKGAFPDPRSSAGRNHDYGVIALGSPADVGLTQDTRGRISRETIRGPFSR
jgi:hypothetical protein